jgi:hypothetical protein
MAVNVVAAVVGRIADQGDEFAHLGLVSGQLDRIWQAPRGAGGQGDLQDRRIGAEVVRDIDDLGDGRGAGVGGERAHLFVEVDLRAVADARQRRAREHAMAIGGAFGDQGCDVPVGQHQAARALRADHPASAAPLHRVIDEFHPARPSPPSARSPDGVVRAGGKIGQQGRHDLDRAVADDQRRSPGQAHDRLQRQRADAVGFKLRPTLEGAEDLGLRKAQARQRRGLGLHGAAPPRLSARVSLEQPLQPPHALFVLLARVSHSDLPSSRM